MMWCVSVGACVCVFALRLLVCASAEVDGSQAIGDVFVELV